VKALIATAPRAEPGAMAQLARALILGKGALSDSLRFAESLKASERVLNCIKAPVSGMWTGDPNVPGLLDAQHVTMPFLRPASLFYSAQAGGMVRVPINERASMIAATATAFVRGEGSAVPVSRMSIEAGAIERSDAHALVIVSDQLLKLTGTAGETMISRELRRSIAPAVDEQFLDVILDDVTPLPSPGTDAEAAIAAIKMLLAAVSPTVESRLIFGMSSDVALAGSTLTWPAGGFVFPNLRPTGGSVMDIDVIVSAGLPTGTIVLIDATGLAGDSEMITLEASGQTSIALVDDPTGSSVTPAPTTLVSMFQTNSTALKASAYFGAQRFRDNAVAIMDGIEWGYAGS
jgi:hypothetical protein